MLILCLRGSSREINWMKTGNSPNPVKQKKGRKKTCCFKRKYINGRAGKRHPNEKIGCVFKSATEGDQEVLS